MRRVLLVVSLVAAILGTGASSVQARPIIGCGGIVEWPCPGPAL